MLPAHFADRISSLNFKIMDRTSEDPQTPLFTPFPNIFTIPLNRIPAVSTLNITAFTQVRLIRETYVGADGSDSRIESCRLREVRFCGCEGVEIEDLRLTVQSLKESESWDVLERVVVEGCSSLEYGAVLELIGKERLRYST